MTYVADPELSPRILSKSKKRIVRKETLKHENFLHPVNTFFQVVFCNSIRVNYLNIREAVLN